MLPEIVDVSLLASVDVCSAAFVAKVGIFVSVNAVVLLPDPVEVDMLEVWLGVVTLDVVIVNAEWSWKCTPSSDTETSPCP